MESSKNDRKSVLKKCKKTVLFLPQKVRKSRNFLKSKMHVFLMIESFQQQIVLGPYKVFSGKFWCLCWAHSRCSAPKCAGPIESFGQQIVLGPFNVFVAIFGCSAGPIQDFW